MLEVEVHLQTGGGWKGVRVRGLDDEVRKPRGLALPAREDTVPPDIPALTAALQRGDPAAFDAFYGVYFSRLYRYLLVCSGGWEEGAQEAMQETMIRVIRYIKPFAEEAGLWNWLRRIARTALVDEIRKVRRRSLPMSLARDGIPSDRGSGPDEGDELNHQLRLCLQELGPLERRLIEGKYMMNKSLKGLAREHDLTPKAVESRLARIRKKLKSLLLARLRR